MPKPERTSAARSHCSRPRAVSGTSLLPITRGSRFHAVSPWRMMRRLDASVSGDIRRGLRVWVSEPAELLIVDERFDGRRIAAHRALRITSELQDAHVHAQRLDVRE